MSDEVLNTIIATAGGVIIALLGVQNVRIGRIRRDAKRIRADAAETRDQVANNHVDEEGRPINLREESDDRHREYKAAFTEIMRAIGGIRGQINTLLASDVEIVRQANRDRERLDDLERTQPSARLPPQNRKEEP